MRWLEYLVHLARQESFVEYRQHDSTLVGEGQVDKKDLYERMVVIRYNRRNHFVDYVGYHHIKVLAHHSLPLMRLMCLREGEIRVFS